MPSSRFSSGGRDTPEPFGSTAADIDQILFGTIEETIAAVQSRADEFLEEERAADAREQARVTAARAAAARAAAARSSSPTWADPAPSRGVRSAEVVGSVLYGDSEDVREHQARLMREMMYAPERLINADHAFWYGNELVVGLASSDPNRDSLIPPPTTPVCPVDEQGEYKFTLRRFALRTSVSDDDTACQHVQGVHVEVASSDPAVALPWADGFCLGWVDDHVSYPCRLSFMPARWPQMITHPLMETSIQLGVFTGRMSKLVQAARWFAQEADENNRWQGYENKVRWICGDAPRGLSAFLVERFSDEFQPSDQETEQRHRYEGIWLAPGDMAETQPEPAPAATPAQPAPAEPSAQRAWPPAVVVEDEDEPVEPGVMRRGKATDPIAPLLLPVTSVKPVSGATVQAATTAAEVVIPTDKTATPAVDIVTPKVDIVTPKVDIVTPKVDIVTPAAKAIAPVVEAVAPAAEIVAPVVRPAAPAAEAAAPVVEAAAPVVKAAAPAVKTPKVATAVAEPAAVPTARPVKRSTVLFDTDDFDLIDGSELNPAQSGVETEDESDDEWEEL